MKVTISLGGNTGNEKVRQMEMKYHPRPGLLESDNPESDFPGVLVPENHLGPKIYPKIEVTNEKPKKHKSKKVRGFFFGKPKFFRNYRF